MDTHTNQLLNPRCACAPRVNNRLRLLVRQPDAICRALVRQSRIFPDVECLLVAFCLNRVIYRETYAQKVQCLKRLLGKGKYQDRRVTESVLCDPRCLESL